MHITCKKLHTVASSTTVPPHSHPKHVLPFCPFWSAKTTIKANSVDFQHKKNAHYDKHQNSSKK